MRRLDPGRGTPGDQLAALVDEVAIPGPERYRWRARHHEPSQALPDLPGLPGKLPPAVREVASRLYWQAYTRPDGGRGGYRVVRDRLLRNRFVDALDEANRSRWSWSSGWRVEERDGDRIRLIGRYGRRREVPADAFEETEDDEGLLRREASEDEDSSGWFHAIGERPPEAEAAETLRVYWNLSRAGAVALVSAATRFLNEAGVPFHLKVVDDPQRFRRADAGVLYVARPSWPDAARALPSIHGTVEAHLKPEVPLFTRRLAPGLALAQDPPGGESFGMHRCRLLAEALWQADEAASASRLAQVRAHLEAEGLDPDRPHRHAGSPVPAPTDLAGRDRSSDPPTPERLLQAARGIGDRLADRAVEAGDACTWMPRRVPPSADGGGPSDLDPARATLNPNLYAGTAGVGLFLARLWTSTGDDRHREVAGRALRHALAHARHTGEDRFGEVGARWRLGPYAGTLGIAWALAEAGDRLGDRQLADRGVALARELADEAPTGIPHDLVSGTAGAIPTLLEMHDRFGADGTREAAIRLGEHLLAEAREEERGRSWGDRQRNLTGLSHGASGVGLGLAVLARETGAERWREAALDAFAYERACFDPEAGNWPDFRKEPDASGTHPCETAWCHGAPGIGIARVRAHAALGEPELLEDARRALATTDEIVREEVRNPALDQALCHGVAGKVEARWILEEALGVEDARRRAARALARQLERFGPRARQRWGPFSEWPTGAPAGLDPPLVTGVAGVGHLLLRLRDPRAHPTVLVPPGVDRLCGGSRAEG